MELQSHALPNCSRSPVTERPRFHCPAGQKTVTGTETWKLSSTQLPWVLRYTHVCVHINNVPSEPAAEPRSKWKHSWRWFANLRIHIAKSMYYRFLGVFLVPLISACMCFLHVWFVLFSREKKWKICGGIWIIGRRGTLKKREERAESIHKQTRAQKRLIDASPKVEQQLPSVITPHPSPSKRL